MDSPRSESELRKRSAAGDAAARGTAGEPMDTKSGEDTAKPATAATSTQAGELPFGLPEWPTMHILFLALGIATRFVGLEVPAAVVFDEHHFGRFTNQYMRGTYLFDIHPPLGKLVFFLTAYLTGYDPEPCDYSNIHNKYPPECHFMPLRIVAAAFGCLTVPLVYSICRRMGCRVISASLAAVLFLTDNLNLIESRLILVDSQLIFLASLSLWIALCYWERRRQHEDACMLEGYDYDRLGTPVTVGVTEDAAKSGFDVVEADDVVNRGYGSLGVWVPPPFSIIARPGRRVYPEDDVSGTEILNPVAVEAAAFGIGRPFHERNTRPAKMTLTERVLWSVGLGVVCGCAVSIKWTNLATPGMIALESFFGLYYLREPAPLPDILMMGAGAISIYAFWFYLHFAFLPLSGDGDGFMRMEFQKTLVGNSNYDANAPKPGFLTNFIQLNQEMLSANARIDTPHHWMSKWWSWPINGRGVLYYSTDMGGGNQQLVYLLGNPAAIWLVLLGVLGGFAVLIVYCRYRSGQAAFYPNWVRAFASSLTYVCLVWLINLIPYILVSRAAFVYHYMPALLYGEIAVALLVDKLAGKHVHVVVRYLMLAVVAVWCMFAPWVYGITVSTDYHSSLRWMKGWD